MSRDSIWQPQLLLIRRPPLLLGESIRPGGQQGWKQKVNDRVVQLCCLKQSKPLLTSVLCHKGYFGRVTCQPTGRRKRKNYSLNAEIAFIWEASF